MFYLHLSFVWIRMSLWEHNSNIIIDIKSPLFIDIQMAYLRHGEGVRNASFYRLLISLSIGTEETKMKSIAKRATAVTSLWRAMVWPCVFCTKWIIALCTTLMILHMETACTTQFFAFLGCWRSQGWPLTHECLFMFLHKRYENLINIQWTGTTRAWIQVN